jgi:TolB protein
MKQILFLLSLMFVFASTAHARIYIRIDEISEQKFPIAISNLVNAGKKRDSKNWSRKIPEILNNDLRLSGLFEFVEKDLYPGEDAKNYKPDKVNFTVWKILGIQGLVKGGFTYGSDGKVKAELYLYDPIVGEQLIGHQYNANKDDFRQVAHHFADMIMEALTGYPGIFRTRLAFVCSNSSSKEICSMGVDGHGVARITADRNINISPAWSPGGGKIAYTSYTDDGFAQLKVIDLASKKTTQITNQRGVFLAPDWTPDGKMITASVSQEEDNIFNVSLGGKLVQKLTHHWSITAFTFSSERAGGLHVFRADADGGNVQRLTFVGYQNDNPAWSPDGEKIVFQGRDQGVWDLFIMNSDGSVLQRLTSSAGNNQEPTWAPNSQYIGFASNRAGGFMIYLMTAQGESQTAIGPGTMPSWGPLPKREY